VTCILALSGQYLRTGCKLGIMHAAVPCSSFPLTDNLLQSLEVFIVPPSPACAESSNLYCRSSACCCSARYICFSLVSGLLCITQSQSLNCSLQKLMIVPSYMWQFQHKAPLVAIQPSAGTYFYILREHSGICC